MKRLIVKGLPGQRRRISLMAARLVGIYQRENRIVGPTQADGFNRWIRYLRVGKVWDIGEIRCSMRADNRTEFVCDLGLGVWSTCEVKDKVVESHGGCFGASLNQSYAQR